MVATVVPIVIVALIAGLAAGAGGLSIYKKKLLNKVFSETVNMPQMNNVNNDPTVM